MWKRQTLMRWWIIAICFPAIALVVSAQNRGSITGRITWEGAPAAGVRVAALAANSTDAASALYGITQTDADGRYRLDDVPAGRYYIVAGPVQAPTYHPGVENSANATILTVVSGVVSGMDFTANPARLPPQTGLFAPFGQSASNCPAAGAAAPAQPVTAADFVEVERTTCSVGMCQFPQYSVRIYGDGRVVWNGRQFVLVTGSATATVNGETARALIEGYRAAGFYGLCERNRDTGQGVISTVQIAGQVKRVSSGPGMADLEKEVDRLADTHRWIHGDPLAEVLSYGSLTSDAQTGTKPGITALMQASARGTVGANVGVSSLLTAKRDPNAQDASGWIPLMYAALASDASIVKALLENGANPNLRSHSGLTPIMAQIAISNDITRDPITAIQLLLAAGADINEADGKGRTALMMTIPSNTVPQRDPSDILRLLLAAGADVNATDSNGQTAIMMTIHRSLGQEPDDTAPLNMARANLVALLRDNGARVDIRDNAGKTALDLLDEEARRAPSHPKAQFAKMKLILEQPQPNPAPVHVRGTIHPRDTDLQSITLLRAGTDPIRFGAAVNAGGSVEFPAILPGVYTAFLTPPPVFPVSTQPLAIPNTNVANLDIAVPAVRQLRVTVSVQGGGALPVFWLLLAARADNAGPVSLSTRPEVRPLPANMTAALSAGARLQVIQLGGPVNGTAAYAVRNSLPVYASQIAELSQPIDGAYTLTLAEGEYVVTPLLAPPGLSYPPSFGQSANGVANKPVVTSDMFSISARSGGMDLASEPMRVNGPGQEIQITFTRP